VTPVLSILNEMKEVLVVELKGVLWLIFSIRGKGFAVSLLVTDI